MESQGATVPGPISSSAMASTLGLCGSSLRKSSSVPMERERQLNPLRKFPVSLLDSSAENAARHESGSVGEQRGTSLTSHMRWRACRQSSGSSSPRISSHLPPRP